MTNKTIFIIGCGCGQIAQTGFGDSEACQECKEIAQIIEVCIECSEEACTCKP